MATTKLYLDTRGVNECEEAPIKIGLTKHGHTSYYSLNIKVEKSQWDAKTGRVINHPNKMKLNSVIQNKKTAFDNALLELEARCETGGKTATMLKNMIANFISPNDEETQGKLFLSWYKKYANECKSESTRRIYNDTIPKIEAFDKKASLLSFEDVTKGWIDSFEKHLINKERLSTNTISIHLRNIRAVFNSAIDNEITNSYPFRKKKIKNAPTKKRALSIEQLRNLFNYDVEPFQRKYIDTFKLCFMLIGINIVDLCSLTQDNIIDGRLEYIRAKTGKKYSIKIEQEALDIINKYKGKNKLFSFAENVRNYRTFATALDKGLKGIGQKETRNGKLIRHSAFKGLSIYWARHTWATIAANIDIPRETITAALGHDYGSKTTAIYIDFDLKKVDEANRRVLDYVLYDKH